MGAPRPGEIARQFGEHARLYAVSKAHAEGATRHILIERMQPVADEWLLDVGSGPGPVAVAFAPYVAHAVAFDLAPEMLHAARLAARRAEVTNVAGVCGDVHRLPFGDRRFALVTSRACPHHFADIGRAVAEMARVLARGGRIGIADGTVPDDPEIDVFLNRLDTLHDPTTVRNYSAREWRGFFADAGLRVDAVDDYVVEIPEGRSLLDWLARSGASSAVAEQCRRMLLDAPAKTRDYLRVRPDGDDVRFELPRVVITATRTS
ncbi:MAG: methyltransferase domain-containing protein [Candidatus Eisenbacteria bacterium]|nr:methyltransferase domain-containing protein [Candidatus Eisenbacteria bacterium]